MNITLLVLFLLLSTFLLGYAWTKIYNSIGSAIKNASPKKEALLGRFAAYFSSGALMMLFFAGLLNIVAVFINLNLFYTKKLFIFCFIVLMTISYFVMLGFKIAGVRKKMNSIGTEGENKTDNAAGTNGTANANDIAGINDAAGTDHTGKNAAAGTINYALIMAIATALLLIGELVFVALGKSVRFSTDQMAETVNAFRSTGVFYSVNPLTGSAYTADYPGRLNVMLLPTFYAVLAECANVKTTVLLWNVMPAYWLLAGFCSFYRVGAALFDRDDSSDANCSSDMNCSSDANFASEKKVNIKNIAFLFVSAFLLLCANIGPGLVGFDVFHRGYSAGNVLCLIIVPLAFSFVLEKKWLACVITMAVELFVAQTQYGVGACFVITVFFFIAGIVIRKKNVKNPDALKVSATANDCDAANDSDNDKNISDTSLSGNEGGAVDVK